MISHVSMKKEEHMESELSGIFQVNVVTKNIAFGSFDVSF